MFRCCFARYRSLCSGILYMRSPSEGVASPGTARLDRLVNHAEGWKMRGRAKHRRWGVMVWNDAGCPMLLPYGGDGMTGDGLDLRVGFFDNGVGG